MVALLTPTKIYTPNIRGVVVSRCAMITFISCKAHVLIETYLETLK